MKIKKENNQNKKERQGRRKEEKKGNKNLSKTRSELAPLDGEYREKYTASSHWAIAAGDSDCGWKWVYIPSLQWLAVFRKMFFCFAFNY